MLNLVSKLKINTYLKLLLVGVKANSSIRMRLEMAGVGQNKQRSALFSLRSLELE